MATTNSRSGPCRHCFLPILFLCCCFSLHIRSCVGGDTISLGHSLSGNQTIVSKEGVFELGFFSPGKSRNYYIGIWYKNRPEKSVVWVANREAPASNAPELKISQDGNLVILNQSQQTWSSNISPLGSNSTIALLLDTGNFVLINRSDPSMVFWQSFDHPTDTWLPGARVGWNAATKQYMTLTSWRSPEDPAPGYYSFGMDPKGVDQLVQMWNGSEYYWTSGRWNGQYFSSVPELTRNQIYKYIYVESENYVTYTASDAKVALITRFLQEVSGEGTQLAWLNTTPNWIPVWSQPKFQCQIYSFCGPFSICNETSAPICSCLPGFQPASNTEWDSGLWNGGCVRKTQLKCENRTVTEDDKFLPISNVQLPTNPKPLGGASAEDECRVVCLNNCSCFAYSYNGSNCLIWDKELENLKTPFDSNGNVGELFLRLAASEIQSSSRELQHSSNGANVGAIVGASLGGVVLIVVILLVLTALCRKRRLIRAFKQAKQGSLVLFSYGDLESLTKNFAERLGGGGFGSVFKGILPDSTAIAVKKLEGLRQGEKQFRTEVSTMGTIQHVNLVRLRGFCCEGDNRLLVYDYMPNGSLDSYLTTNNSKLLDWKERFQIAIGTAKGLAYLHEQCRDCIMHCDIKPENILLDEDLCPKVSDFGMAKLIGRDISRVMTTMRGTVGYLAPEWISGLPITPKADVYSFGMVLFELIAGRRNARQHEDGQVKFFPVWAAEKVIQDDVIDLLDDKLKGDADAEELRRVCRVACWCIQDEEAQRPSMGQVVQMLEGILETGIPPMPTALQLLVDDVFSGAFVLRSSDSDTH